MRHTGAGLAIPDFPLMFGHLVPTTGIRRSRSTSRIASARSSSSLGVLATAGRTSGHAAGDRRDARRDPRRCSLVLVAVQVTLGALTVLSRRDVWINSVHVVCGALVLDDVAGADAAQLANEICREATEKVRS